MATVAEARSRLRRPLERELAGGCRDDVVVGGLERLLDGAGRPFAEVVAVLRGYGGLGASDRRARLERALAMLADAEGSRAVRADVGRRGPTPATPPPAPPAGADRALDAPIDGRSIDLGAQAPRKLGEIGLRTYRDLLEFVPRRWEDRRTLPSIADAAALEVATVAGTVRSRRSVATRRGGVVLRATVEDGTGGRLVAVWFNQPWVEGQLFPGQRVIATGKVRRQGRGLELHVSSFEVDDGGERLSTGRIVAVYGGLRGTSQAYLRQAVDRLLRSVPSLRDPVPAEVRRDHGLVDADRAWRALHQPGSDDELEAAQVRLRFEEYLLLELRVLLQRDAGAAGRAIVAPDAALERFRAALPYTLTRAQERAIDEIRRDMAGPRQMARLLQGDVGSGKTAVAAAAVHVAVAAGTQAAVMAPTEILARQHFLNLQALLWPLGVRVDLLIGSQAAGERRAVRDRAAAHGTDLVVGTHALIQEGVSFADLGLAVIDEEHRFGVEQRRALIAGAPDVLVMSATPIPRSLALTAYGDLDLTVMDEMPPGRTPVVTELVRAAGRPAVYGRVLEAVRAGAQAYVVAPAILEDEEGELVAATALADDLARAWGDEVRLGLVHGRLPGTRKDAVMEAFRRRELDVLVATTVIEVGVDVPNASLMVIENAERFGLSQLHQLRGRVGRGHAASRCVLIAGEASRATMQRLRVLVEHPDGFVIAEKDLELRGPGELRGTRQSGLLDLRFGDLARDAAVIERARACALEILGQDARLEAPRHAGLRAAVARQQRAAGFRETL